MGILDEDVAAVRAASDIVGIVTQYTPLRRVGRRWEGLCPFHTEKTASFKVNGEEGLYICYGCRASGDVITFVREKEQLDFVGAVEWLAAKANITLHYTDRAEGEGRKRRAKLVEIMAKAVDWYHERLLSAADAGTARRYLRERGLDGDVVREFKIGWAPDSWDDLCKALRLDADDARDTGLGFVNSRNRLQDSFRARVLFPIFDPQGDPVSLGGRILPGGEGPGNKGKYKNTPETPLYHKSKVLYGLERAKAHIVSADTAVVCEGYTDVIGFHRNGVPLAVATCGTALTDDHVKLLRRYARSLVLAFDADGAGQAAAERFYQWEREHDLDVKVADLPVGRDPGDLAQSQPELLPAAIEGARPFLRFRLDRAFAAADLSSPEGRAKAAEKALALLAEHPAELVRDQYLIDIASRVRVDPERLRPQLDELRRNPPRPAPGDSRGRRSGQAEGIRRGGNRSDRSGPAAPTGPTGRGPGPTTPGGQRSAGDVPPPWADGGRNEEWIPPPWGEPGQGNGSGPPRQSAPADNRPRATGRPNGRRDPTERPALELLRHAVHNRAEIEGWLRPELFADPRHRQVLDALAAAPSAGEAVAAAPPDVADLLARLVVEEPDSEPFDAVRRLLTEVARAAVSDLRLGAATAEDPADVLAGSAFLGRCIDGLRNPQASVEAADRLLAWLAQRVGDGG